jgi:hypothetical protein
VNPLQELTPARRYACSEAVHVAVQREANEGEANVYVMYWILASQETFAANAVAQAEEGAGEVGSRLVV